MEEIKSYISPTKEVLDIIKGINPIDLKIIKV